MFNPNSAFDTDYFSQPLAQIKEDISPLYLVDETSYLESLIPWATPTERELAKVTEEATALITEVRSRSDAIGMIDALLLEYSLDTREGVLLMCLAEALMRIPDGATADALIKDKLSIADWKQHLKQSDSLLVNASTWGLLLTGKIIQLDESVEDEPVSIINRLVNRLSEPVVRQAMNQAMRIMGKQFVLGRTINEALGNSKDNRKKGFTYSYDMLGEAALTNADAERYLTAYENAIQNVGADNFSDQLSSRPTISVKLSALHPRYESQQRERVLTELYERMLKLIRLGRSLDVGITIDAEEMDRLELSLDLFEKLYRSDAAKGWGKFGLVVQAYSKRALPVLCWLVALSKSQGDLIPLRLVKGAYWDSEIKLAQQQGLSGYPVFTRKEATDVSYLVCARFLMGGIARGHVYPQFASHNAHTVASIYAMADHDEFEFQRLHGMGDALYNSAMGRYECPVRIYAPVGQHKDLLPYLVRRLLENGANSSFVHRLIDLKTPVESLTHHPVKLLKAHDTLANNRIPLPTNLFGEQRVNSIGTNVHIDEQWLPLKSRIASFFSKSWLGGPLVNGELVEAGQIKRVHTPFDHLTHVGSTYMADEAVVANVLDHAEKAFVRWDRTPVVKRAALINRAADLLEEHKAELIALCHLEAGKTVQDGIDEVREAVDFCRYYAQQASVLFSSTVQLPGPTGESNEYFLQGRGVFVCISPWNFPLAIFTGQLMAALAAGNTVIAKPAEQTGLIAHRAVELFHEAGIPGDVLQLVPGPGSKLGPLLTSDPRVAGVAFTGSTQTAQHINRNLAEREGPIASLIAETGGQNAMIVDSTALPEQVVKDVVASAFTSAGQRCSALRVLFVQNDVADRMLGLLKGAMQEISIGDPCLLETDVGPVIDEGAKAGLLAHIADMREHAELVAETKFPVNLPAGNFVAPIAFEIKKLNQLKEEHFGPILHIIRYKATELDQVIEQINDSGFGLTLGIHSRNESTARYIDENVRVGNVYINRNQIGAVVGVQPFGGQGLSGTGPKAGGPHYLLRFATERTRTTNTTAIGGNATLLSLESSVV